MRYISKIIVLTFFLINSCQYNRLINDNKKSREILVSTLIEFFKEDFSHENRNRVQFNVLYFMELDGWACVNAEPFIPNEFIAEMRWMLFRKDYSGWKVVRWEHNIDFENDFELIDLPIRYSRIAKLIVENHPDCPMEIFPMNDEDRGLAK